MVRFTVRDLMRAVSMRLDLSPEEPISEISCIASEYWGSDGFVIRKGYSILDYDGVVGDLIQDGDELDLVPDPATPLRL